MTRVISAPQGLKWAASAVFLTVPIAAVQAKVMVRAPWWAMPIHAMEVSAIWTLACSILVSFFILKAHKSFRGVLIGIGVLWVGVSALASIRTHNPSMGFFTIFLGVYFGMLTSWVKYEFSRSFFDPKMNWFEGAPRSIPALDCEVAGGEEKQIFKVSRLDSEGTFLFVQEPKEPVARRLKFASRRKEPSELVFRFRDREIHCQGVPMLLFKRNSEGVGFRFAGNTPDQNKKLGDFIETLRGEGYV